MSQSKCTLVEFKSVSRWSNKDNGYCYSSCSRTAYAVLSIQQKCSQWWLFILSTPQSLSTGETHTLLWTSMRAQYSCANTNNTHPSLYSTPLSPEVPEVCHSPVTVYTGRLQEIIYTPDCSLAQFWCKLTSALLHCSQGPLEMPANQWWAQTWF